MSRIKSVLASLLLVLAFAFPVSAQDATPEITPEPPPVVVVEADPLPPIIDESENPVLLVVIGVLTILVVLLSGAVLYLANKGYNMLPSWAKDFVLSNRVYVERQLDTGFDTLDRAVALTPNTLDDLIAKFGREFVEERVRKFYGDITPPAVG